MNKKPKLLHSQFRGNFRKFVSITIFAMLILLFGNLISLFQSNALSPSVVVERPLALATTLAGDVFLPLIYGDSRTARLTISFDHALSRTELQEFVEQYELTPELLFFVDDFQGRISSGGHRVQDGQSLDQALESLYQDNMLFLQKAIESRERKLQVYASNTEAALVQDADMEAYYSNIQMDLTKLQTRIESRDIAPKIYAINVEVAPDKRDLLQQSSFVSEIRRLPQNTVGAPVMPFE